MSGHSGRPGPEEYSPYYSGYVARVPTGDLVTILASQLDQTLELLNGADGDRKYADNKWTIREVVGHMADTERVMAYRALRIARGDTTPLPGFDQDQYVPAGEFAGRSLDDLLAELALVRKATVALFTGLPDRAWFRQGTASEAAVTVRGLACIIAGHELHHRVILAERYLATT